MYENEEWKDCVGYEGLYQISNYGRVKSLDRLVWNRFQYVERSGRMMKLQIDRYGYMRVCLLKNRKKTFEQVHRLAAIAFIENPNNYPQVNHKDANKKNNFVGTKENNYLDGNLEWCTNQQNMEHAHQHIDFNYITRPVLQIDIENHIVIKKFNSIQDASREISDNPSNIWKACNFDNDSAKGYRWRFDDGSYNIGDYVELPKLFHPSTRKRKVAQIKDNIIIAIYDCIMDAARDNDCIDSAIGSCCKGKIGQHHGYQWAYYTPDMKVGDVIAV